MNWIDNMHDGTKGEKMPKQKATFQPTVRPDWAGALDYMSESEQSKIFQAILMFPSIDLPESAYWNKTIKPDLQNQYETFMSVCEKKAIGIRKRWENAKGIDKYSSVIDMNTTLQDKNSNEQDMLYIVKDKDKNKDKENKGGVGEIDFDTTFKAGGQLWELPPQFRKLALTKYTESEIRAFEMTHSCHESLEDVCLNDIKHEEPKPKKKQYGEEKKVKLTDEEFQKLQAVYGVRIDMAIDILDRYIAQKGKNPYKDHYAVMKRNGWVHTKVFQMEYIPSGPEIADKSKFVRAKPL